MISAEAFPAQRRNWFRAAHCSTSQRFDSRDGRIFVLNFLALEQVLFCAMPQKVVPGLDEGFGALALQLGRQRVHVDAGLREPSE